MFQKQNVLNLNTINNESSTASEDLKVNYNGDDIEIGFNSKYIMDIVNNLDDDKITLKLKDGSSPITAQEKSNSNLNPLSFSKLYIIKHVL